MDIFNRIIPTSILGNQENPLGLLLNQLFYAGLAVAVILAVVMIIVGGVQYMTIDAAAQKDTGKKRVQAALGGLVLAFSAILILNTINPNLTKLSLYFPQIERPTAVEVEAQIVSSVNQYQGISPQQVQEYINTGKIPNGLSPSNQRVLAEALNAVNNLKTGAIPGTDGGNLACAAAVNKIIESALGKPINKSLSTIEMNKSLSTSDRFTLVGSNYADAMPGDIIISPTGAKVGHVGIVAAPGAAAIISNSSRNAQVQQNFSAQSWKKRYENDRNLQTYIYRPL